MPFWNLVLYTIDVGGFFSDDELQFGDYQVMASFEEREHSNAIQIDFLDENAGPSLVECFTVLSQMFAGDGHKNIDFQRGLLYGDKELREGTKYMWQDQALLRKDGTFCLNCDIPRK